MRVGRWHGWAGIGHDLTYHHGTLDLREMDSCDVRIDTLGVGLIGVHPNTGQPATAPEQEEVIGIVALPPGTASANTVTLGHPYAASANSQGLLHLNGTSFTVNASLTLHGTGKVETVLNGTSAALDLADGAALTATSPGGIDIVFAAPSGSGLYYGLRWAGDHVAELQAMAEGDTPTLTWDATLLDDPVAIFFQDGYTYVGLTVALATLDTFTVADASSGSALATNDPTIAVAIAGTAAEGAAVEGYVINETGIEPADGWAASVTSYTIEAASGSTVTLYGWMKDSIGNVVDKTATIYYNSTAPVVLTGPTITDNGDGTATATWTTDIPAEGSVEYGPVAMSGATPNTAAEGAVGTSHSIVLTGIAAGSNYKIVLVNTEVASAPIYWPRPWPIEGDSNQDCRVNILDLIFIRNKLNLDVATGDNWKGDVNEDGRTNILDLIYVRNKLNTQCP